MSQENVELVRRWASVIEGADPDAFATMIDAIFAADAEMIEDPRWPGSATVKGREAINARAHEYFEGVAWHFTIEDVLDAGKHVVVLLRGQERGDASGIEIKLEWACLLSFERGDLQAPGGAFWPFRSTYSASRALGLRE